MIDKESMYPSYIDNTDFRCVEMDGKFIASIILYEFPKFNTFLSIVESIPKDIEYTMSIYIQKQDTYKILKELMHFISTSKSEIKTAKSSQIDIDLMTKSSDDANALRKEIQINNQEIFYTNFILTFYSSSKDNLLKILKRFQSKLYSKQLYSKIANFRHLDEYILSLPLNKKGDDLLKQNYKNFTTNALSNIFPFYTKTIFDKNGIVFGKIASQNSVCSIDMFKNNYLNSNMCILGSSGAGKSFFAKLLIIREHIAGKQEYIFDVEGEYSNMVKKLGGEVFSFSNNHINILEITESEINMYKESVYNVKISKVIKLISKLFKIDDNEILEDIYQGINKSYKDFNIIGNVSSLYINDENKVYLKKKLRLSKDYPTLLDVIKNLKLKKSKDVLLSNKNKFEYLFGITDVDLNNNLISFDICKVNINNVKIFLRYLLEDIVEKLKSNKEKNTYNTNTIIYIDEVWKYVINNDESDMFNYIFELFKTIRKLSASIVIITQDISDIFSKENESYGKSILNNCFFKVIFRLDFSDIEILSNISGINNQMLENVNTLDKGQAQFIFNNNILKLLIEANEYEKELIEGDVNGYFSSSW